MTQLHLQPQAHVNHLCPLDCRQFQWRFLTVYFIMSAADWAQGPYVYHLYEHYGFTIAQNGQLFIAGFAASLSLGTLAGSLSDKRGRRFGERTQLGYKKHTHTHAHAHTRARVCLFSLRACLLRAAVQGPCCMVCCTWARASPSTLTIFTC